MCLLRGFSPCLLISCMVKRWHPDKPLFTSEQSTSYVCRNSLEKSLAGCWGVHECWKYFTNVAQRPGKTVCQFLEAQSGEELLYSRARGAGEDRRSVGRGVGGDGVGCFLCDCPWPSWSRLQTTHSISPLRVSKVRLLTKAAISLSWDQIFPFSEIFQVSFGFLSFDLEK